MTCIRPGDCAVCQESIRDPFGSASPLAERLIRREHDAEAVDGALPVCAEIRIFPDRPKEDPPAKPLPDPIPLKI